MHLIMPPHTFVRSQVMENIVPNTDGLINELLVMGCEAMEATLDNDDKMEKYKEKLNGAVNSTFNMPSDAPDEAMDELLGDDQFKELSKLEYASFKLWMDGTHPGWEAHCGLVSEINPATDRAEWVVPGTYA